MSTVTIAGAGPLARALSQRLPARLITARRPSDPSWWRADLSSIPEAEVALAGTTTLVVLASNRGAPARLTRATREDLDLLVGDSLARAAKRCGVQHVVVYACGEREGRVPLLRAAGLPMSVLVGGGPDPVPLLETLIARGPGEDLVTAAWSAPAPSRYTSREDLQVCSVQRYARPPGWSAERLARAYFSWLPTQFPTVRTSRVGAITTLSVLGVRALVLRESPGRSEPDSFLLECVDGALSRRAASAARFEFRVLLDGATAMTALIGFEPTLPFFVYRLSQAFLHERIMRRFGIFLADQK